MKISGPELVEYGNLVRYEVNIISEYLGTKTLFYELEKKYMYMVSDNVDAALVGLLMPAMYYGEDIYVEGKVSEKLYWDTSYRLQKLLQTFMPLLNQISVYTENTIPGNEPIQEGECVTGFSGGIDSFCTLADYFYDPLCPKSSKVTMLTYNNVGSHWGDEEGYHLFLRKYEKLSRVASKIGLPFVKINSNLDDFYINENLRFTKTLVMRNASVALLLQKGVKKFLHSSSLPYEHLMVKNSVQQMTQIEPFVLQILSSCDDIEILSVGSEYSRVEKTEIVSNIEHSYEFLDVCTTEGKDKTNCSACVKCLRTLTTLEILGALELYSESFNLEIYKKNKNRFLGKVLVQNDEFTKEIYDLAQKKKFAFPVMSYLYSLYYKLRYLIRKR